VFVWRYGEYSISNGINRHGYGNKISVLMFIFFFLDFLAYRIHSSETTADLLQEIGGFHLEYRGVTDIKVHFQ
jgi:hypothetical protein